MRFGMRPRGLVVAALAISAVVVASASANGGQRGLRFEAPQISQGAQALRTAAESPPLLFPSLDALAPSLGGTFGTINFDEQATTSGYYSTPPDNSAAAGPNQVIDTANTVIEWWTKSGTMQSRQSLKTFFTATPGGAPLTNMFDPKVIYDQSSGRFVIVALDEDQASASSTTGSSRIYVAVSDDSDPNGTWYRTFINSDVTIGPTTHYWTDFPGLATDANAVYITGNQYTYDTEHYGGTRLWIISKTGFYSGGAATAKGPFDPYNAAGTAAHGTLAPTQMFGTPAGVGTYLVAYNGLATSTQTDVQVITVGGTPASPTFANAYVAWGSYPADDSIPGNLADAPQLGSAQGISAGDGRISENGVWRNNNLYVAFSTQPSAGADAGQDTARWVRLNTSGSLSLADTGAVGGNGIAAGAFTSYPAVNVDSAGNMAIGFSASSPTTYAGSFYTGRLAGDSAGTTQPVSTLHAGLDYYYRAFGGSENRWGDYSSVALDPDGKTFWVFNEYAMAHGTVLAQFASEDGRWATSIGHFTFGATPPPPKYTLTLSKAGTAAAAGLVTGNGINCGSTCSASYNAGTVVTLAESHNGSNSTFVGWSGACSGTGACSITMNGAKSVTATFNQKATPPRCVVPKVVGKKLVAAKTKIVASHCKVGKVTRAKSSKKKKGRVLRQSPAAGKHLANGSKVNLTVGRGTKH